MKIREIAKQSPLEEGAISNKILPGLSFADAGIRVAQQDYPGAAIAGTAAGLSLIPTIPTQGASIGLEVFNQLRDEAARRGGWKNLGRDMMKSVGDGDFDHIHMLPEDFAKLDQLEESGQLDEGGLSSIPGWIAKYGDDAVRWLKNLRKSKPDAPTTKPPLNAAEREAAERAEELAAREAEKQTKVVDRRRQPKSDEAPVINKDTPAAPTQAYPKYDPKVHGSKEDYLKNLTKDEFDRYKSTQELLSKDPVKPGWVRRGGAWVLDNPLKTIGGLGTGYYFTPDPVKDFVKDKVVSPVTDFVTDKVKADAAKAIQANQDRIKELEAEKQKYRQEQERKQKDQQNQPSSEPSSERPAQPAEPEQAAPPPLSPLEQQKQKRREQGLPYSSLGTEEPVAERRLAEKYQQFLNDAEQKPSYTKEQYIGWAKKYAEQYKIPLPMVLHAMFKETGWLGDPERMRTATSPTGARGVMQIQPEYAEKGAYKIKVKDLTDPEKNIEAGTRGLAYYFNKYKDPQKALAAYNAGEGGASTFLKTGDPKTLRTRETRKYIQGYKDDVIYQIEKFFPKNKDKVSQVIDNIGIDSNNKIAQVATDVLATVVGAGNAQAANSAATKNFTQVAYPRSGTPIDQKDFDYKNPNLVPIDGRVQKQMQDLSRQFQNSLDTALKDYKGSLRVTGGTRTQQDQTRLYNAYIADQKILRDHGGNAAEARKYGYKGLEQASKNLGGHAGYAIDVDPGDLLKFHKWLQINDPNGKKYGLQTGYSWSDPDRVHLELKNWSDIDDKRKELNKTLPKDKQLANAAEYDRYQDQLRLAAQDEVKKAERLIDPGLGGAPEARADTASKADKKDPLKFPSIQSDIPSVDYQSQGDDTPAKSAEKKAEKPADKPADKDKPKAKTRTTTDATGRETTYTQNEKGQWVDPRGNIMPTPEKPGSRKDLDITDKGGEPSAADVEKSRNITGRQDPLIDPDTGFRTTEKALRDKLAQRAADEKAAAEREAKRIADLEKIQRDAEARKKAEKPVDKGAGKADAGKADAGTGLAGTDTGKDKGKAADKKDQQRAPDAVAPDAKVPKVDVRKEFEKAFAAARAKQAIETGKGSGGTFKWTNPLTGKEGTFTTDYGDEVPAKAKKAATVSAPDITSQDTQDRARRASQFKPEPEKVVEPEKSDSVDPRLSKIPYDVVRKQVKPDYTVDADPDALKVPRADSSDKDSLPPVIVTAVPEPANVLRSKDGKPVTSGTGEPWGTGTSTKDDLERAKKELQKKIDDEKAKKDLEKIAPDLSKEVEPEDTFRDKWSRGIEWLTGKKIPDPKEMDKIRVPESVNTELKDILWLAGRIKR